MAQSQGGQAVSNTFRTDEQTFDVVVKRGDAHLGREHYKDGSGDFVESDFCRQLERQLNAANERIKRLEEDLMDSKNQYAVLVADVVLYEDRGERITRLEEAGNNLLWNFCPEYTSDLTQEQSDALKQWNQAKEAKP
jgi:hypothetical protein